MQASSRCPDSSVHQRDTWTADHTITVEALCVSVHACRVPHQAESIVNCRPMTGASRAIVGVFGRTGPTLRCVQQTRGGVNVIALRSSSISKVKCLHPSTQGMQGCPLSPVLFGLYKDQLELHLPIKMRLTFTCYKSNAETCTTNASICIN